MNAMNAMNAMNDHCSSKHKSLRFTIEGMTCAGCVKKIETAAANVTGVENALVNFADHTLSVSVADHEPEMTDAVLRAVETAGYHAQEIHSDSEEDLLAQKEAADQAHYKKQLRACIVALMPGLAMMIWGLSGGEMAISSAPDAQNVRIGWLVAGLLTLMIMVMTGRHFYINAWNSFKNHTATMDTLIALGTGAAWVYSFAIVAFPDMVPAYAAHVYFEATLMIIGLINLGQALEIRARGKTGQAIRQLIGLQAKTARILREDKEEDIPIEQVLKGDHIRLRPGENVAVDGLVLEGNTSIDESMLTGEPISVAKKMGDTVSAGTVNGSGTLIYEATLIGQETALARIIGMVRQAQNSRPPIGNLADVISAWFVPVVMLIAIVSALLWVNLPVILSGAAPEITHAVIAAVTVLIIACPCALGLATPMSVMVGVGKAAQAGVLIRNGDALQTASKITTMVLDKTGTITEGKPEVTDIHLTGNLSEADVLPLIGGLEKASEHPLAEAVMTTLRDKNLTPQIIDNFCSVTGYGIQGEYQKQHLLLGNKKLMRENHITFEEHEEIADLMASDAKTPIWFACDGKLQAIIAIADPIRADSVSAIKRLYQDNIRVVMLTGDNQKTAAAIADKMGITEFYADALPEAKAEKVKELQAAGEIVGMSGDGINDAPALALADVGFAIGSGTDVAMESADITLMRPSLHGLVDAIEISRSTLRNIKQNLFGAFIYNSAGIPIAAGILYPFFGILLSPIIAGGAMALSSLSVVLNANRLRFFQTSAHSGVQPDMKGETP